MELLEDQCNTADATGEVIQYLLCHRYVVIRVYLSSSVARAAIIILLRLGVLINFIYCKVMEWLLGLKQAHLLSTKTGEPVGCMIIRGSFVQGIIPRTRAKNKIQHSGRTQEPSWLVALHWLLRRFLAACLINALRTAKREPYLLRRGGVRRESPVRSVYVHCYRSQVEYLLSQSTSVKISKTGYITNYTVRSWEQRSTLT